MTILQSHPSPSRESALISTCDKGKQPKLVVEAFQAMKRVPGVTTRGFRISVCEKGKRLKLTLAAFQAM